MRRAVSPDLRRSPIVRAELVQIAPDRSASIAANVNTIAVTARGGGGGTLGQRITYVEMLGPG